VLGFMIFLYDMLSNSWKRFGQNRFCLPNEMTVLGVLVCSTP